MYPWNKIPLFRAFLPIFAGIIFAIYLPKIKIPLLSFLLLTIIGMTVIFVIQKNNFKWRWIFPLIIYLVLFIECFYFTISYSQYNNSSYFVKYLNPQSLIVAKIVDPPEEKEKSYFTTINIYQVKNGNKIHRCQGKSILIISKDKISSKLRYGDMLVVKNKFREIKGSLNPGQFDYKSYLGSKQIYYQAFAGKNDWNYFGLNEGNLIYKKILNIRDEIIIAFKKSFPKKDQSAVLNSLIIGYRSGISPGLMESFVNTGTIHILSVSGLHVGIVYFVFYFLLLPLRKIKGGKIINMLILMLLLWLYAIMTGLAPCVARAALMFSFVVVGNNLGRISNIYSSILASAILILLINPYVIKDLGFQLSYTAVLGIVMIQPILYKIIKPKYKIPDKIWILITVSVAAQIMTFPLSLYYFNQFPLYFIIANLVAIPISTIIIYGGLIFLLFNFSGILFISDNISKVLAYLVEFMGNSLNVLKNLPFAVKEGLYLNLYAVILIYIIVILLFIFYFNKRKSYVIAIMISIVLLMFNIFIHKYQAIRNREIMVYSVYPQKLYSFINGNQAILYGDSSILDHPDVLRNIIYKDFCMRGIKQPDIIKVYSGQQYIDKHTFIKNNCFQFYNKSFLVLNPQNVKVLSNIKRLPTDLIIFSGNPWIDRTKFKALFYERFLVFDSSNNKKKINIWKKICKTSKIRNYDVSENGAFIYKL